MASNLVREEEFTLPVSRPVLFDRIQHPIYPVSREGSDPSEREFRCDLYGEAARRQKITKLGWQSLVLLYTMYMRSEKESGSCSQGGSYPGNRRLCCHAPLLREPFPRTKEGWIMLVLTRNVGEKIIIDDQIKVTVVAIKGGKVRLGIEAPDLVRVDREEVHERRLALTAELPLPVK
jgi:carbon storage regulator